jgi:hypothetical protein
MFVPLAFEAQRAREMERESRGNVQSQRPDTSVSCMKVIQGLLNARRPGWL